MSTNEDEDAILSDLEKLKSISTGDSKLHQDDIEIEDIAVTESVKSSFQNENMSDSDALRALSMAQDGEDLQFLSSQDIAGPSHADFEPSEAVFIQEFSDEKYEESQANLFEPAPRYEETNEDSQPLEILDSDSDEEPEYVNREDLDDEDDIPVSYHNALILNEVLDRNFDQFEVGKTRQIMFLFCRITNKN